MALFQKSVLTEYLKKQDSVAIEKAYKKFVKYFYNPITQQNIRDINEEGFQQKFLMELFVNCFGYVINPDPYYNITTEFKNLKDAKKADGAILINGKAIAVIELKGTNTKNLEKCRQQAFDYKSNHPTCKYIITSNFEKLRFYIDTSDEFEEFNLFTLTENQFALLYLCVFRENLLNNIPFEIKKASSQEEEAITKKLYTDYSYFRKEIFSDLINSNPEYDKLLLFNKTQKLLDRFLFIFFGEDRGLIPANSIGAIINKWEEDKSFYGDRTLFEVFKGYFNVLNVGRPARGQKQAIFAYNGGLFADDEVLDKLKIDDNILLKHTKNLSHYDFESDVSVNILGHIFEHSLSEIEEIQNEISGLETGTSKRKKDGVFYTPQYITKYIVENTVGKLCQEKKNELEINEEIYTQHKARSQKRIDNLNAYRDWLLGLTICDPACGSGAFLIQALNFLIDEHKYVDELNAAYHGASIPFSDITSSILENNLYGVDINEESVDIAKLSLWLRTAKKGRKLTSLNNNLKCGDSLIDDPEIAGDKAFNWEKEFPEVFAKGGFDVVIGNPPYVVKIGVKESQYFRDIYETTQGKKYDLFRFFIEKGLKLLNKKSFLGYITPDVFMHLKQASQLRKYILSNFSVIEVLEAPLDTFDVSVESVVFIIEKPKRDKNYIYLKDIYNHNILKSVVQNDLLTNDYNIDFTSKRTINLINKMNSHYTKIKDIMVWKKGLGVYSRQHLSNKFSAEEVDVIMRDRPWTKNYKVDDTFGKEILGKDIFRYRLEWNSEKWLSYGPWLAFQRPLEFFKGPRLLVREITKDGYYNINASFVEEEYFNNQSMFNGIMKEANDTSDLKYVLGFLNSRLYSYYILISSPKSNRKLFPTILMENIEHFTIPFKNTKTDRECLVNKVDESINQILHRSSAIQNFQKKLINKLNCKTLSKKLQNWHELEFGEFLKEFEKARKKSSNEKETEYSELSLIEEDKWMEYFIDKKQKAQTIKTEIDKTDKEIDQIVYELYGLNKEEIEIIENS